MAKIQKLKDVLNTDILPLTHERAVRDSYGVRLDAKLDSASIKNKITAWDGTSTPIVGNIPEGIVVNYNGTNYTGTLEASSSTDGKIYLVWNNTEFDRYFSTTNLENERVWSMFGTSGGDVEIVNDFVTGGTNKALSAEKGKEFHKDAYGEIILTPTEIGWKDMVSAGNTRTMMFALDKSVVGDVITAKLSDYTNFKFAISLCANEAYSTPFAYDSGWKQQDLSYTVPDGEGNYFIRIAVSKVGDGAISVQEAEAVVSDARVFRVVTTIIGGDIPELKESVDELEETISPYNEHFTQIDNELYGGDVVHVSELEWYRLQRQGTGRVYKWADGVSAVGDVITAKLSDYTSYKFGIALFTEMEYSATTVYDSGWKQQDLSYTVPEGKDGYYIRITIAKTSGDITIEDAKSVLTEAKVVRTIEEDTIGLCARVDKLENDSFHPAGTTEVAYEGDKVVIDMQKNKCYFDFITTISGDAYVQGASVFGDYYFQLAHQMRYVVIYDLKNEVEVQKVNLTTGTVGHANDASFGVEYYDADDPFPLFYVSSEDNKNLFVYRITGTYGEYSFSLVQTITIDTDFYYPNAVVDAYARRCVLFGYKEDSWESSENGNAYLISTFKLPKLSDGNVTVTEFGDTVTLPFIEAQQGAGARSGILYLASGVETPLIYVINYLNGEILSTIDTTVAEDMEPEGLGIWEDRLVVTYRNRKLYVIYF